MTNNPDMRWNAEFLRKTKAARLERKAALRAKLARLDAQFAPVVRTVRAGVENRGVVPGGTRGRLPDLFRVVAMKSAHRRRKDNFVCTGLRRQSL